MSPVFLDTVGLIAVWDKADQWHDDADPVFLKLAWIPTEGEIPNKWPCRDR